MKHVINILFSAACILILNSCSKSFLNEAPTAHLSTATYYQTAADARAAMNAVYAAARPQNFFALYYKIVIGDIMSDDAAKGGGGASDVAEIQQLKLFVAKPDNSYVQNAWQYNFHGVYLANLVLSKISSINMDAAQKTEILAEARFFRAYYYLQLVELFGNVPLITKPLETGDFDQSQATPGAIWTQIETDVDSAAVYLPEQSELTSDEYGRATKGAAYALLMNAYMWEKKWKEAEQLGDQIIHSGQYHLADDYNKIWTTAGEFGPGSIFEISMADIPGKDVGSNVNLWEASRSSWGYGFVCPTQNLVDAFEKGDPRLSATVIYNNEKMPDGTVANTTPSPTGYYNMKYWLPTNEIPYNNGGSAADGPTNERVYRLAVIMLWDAEASVHNGDIAHATDLVNQVRARARESGGNTDRSVLPPYIVVTLDDVYQEERVETALGDHLRFYNLVRTGRAAQILPGYKEGVNNYLPIPLREIQLSNGVLKQNPGY